jgi:hypothetical protein
MNVLAKVLCAAAIALAALPGWSAPGSRSALIVGVSVYASPEVPTLEGVPMDMVSARTMARAMGIPDSRIVELRDAQATKAAILAALENMASSMSEGGRAFLYFSGHGTRWYDPQVQGCKEGLLAHDRQTLTNEEIARSTRRMSELADKVIVLFDACHSDGVGSSAQARTRSMSVAQLTPKFFLKGGQDAEACSRPSNLRTRSLVAEATRLGALQENFVQITSARVDEVSFDEPGKGGLATQGVRQCLLSKATDRNGSGSNSVAEIEQCAQAFVNEKLKPFPDLKPHRITATGNRNIVPVAVPRPPAAVAVATTPQPSPPAAAPAAPARPVEPAPVSAPVAMPMASPAPAPVTPPQPSAPPVAVVAVPTPVAPAPVTSAAPAPAPAVPPVPIAPSVTPPPALASLATLKDIEQQRNPRRQVDIKVSRETLRIGKDPLELSLTSSHAGYVYLVMLGSDRKSFYVLFPNGLDADNRIEARKVLNLPRPDWKLMAQGPEGANHLLVLVTDTRRDLSALTASPPTSAAPFTFALNDLPGRTALLDFLIGQGVTGNSESFGARLLSLKEVR